MNGTGDDQTKASSFNPKLGWEPVERSLPHGIRHEETPFLGIWVKVESADIEWDEFLIGC